jgi:hypothetical protein
MIRDSSFKDEFRFRLADQSQQHRMKDSVKNALTITGAFLMVKLWLWAEVIQTSQGRVPTNLEAPTPFRPHLPEANTPFTSRQSFRKRAFSDIM